MRFEFKSFSGLPLVQAALLTILAFVLLVRFYGLHFNDIVISNYYLGGVSFVNGEDPYERTLRNGPSNQFKYSPLFALGMAATAKLNRSFPAEEALTVVGMFVFFWGLSRWINLSGKLKSIIFFGVLACVLEVVVSLTVKQINALIAGLILLGLAEYRDGRLFSSGAILMLAANLKVYPVVFLVALGLFPRRAYWLGAFIAGLLTFFLPMFFVGWNHNWITHLKWFNLVMADSGGAGVLDLFSALQRLGFGGVAVIIRWLILLITLPLFFSYFRLLKPVDWRPWITFGMSALLLLSPRTEIFTYVLLAPSYVLMTDWFFEQKEQRHQVGGMIASTFLALLIVSCAFTDAKWFYSEGKIQSLRVVGAFGFWLISGAILFRQLSGSLAKSRAGQ